VANLWSISAAMSEGRPADVALVCPASGRPYLTAAEGTARIVSCPNAAAHGARSISVRSDKLVPEVR
jgi:hypothetical protein